MTMIKQDVFGAPAPLPVSIDALIAEHGSWRFVFAAIAGLVRAPMIRRDIADLPAHLRRDIGLPEDRDRPRIREHMW
ncbi:hypothetical protein [Mangrovicoccus ximenensis]|uniref:hypothetical protein n=1 Tax=Mangrovicoccus ximenensis TaxID=1911570 RepID=UPI000D3717FB|nr:hypothetical protein [Mangrovicoccus ximenensis]